MLSKREKHEKATRKRLITLQRLKYRWIFKTQLQVTLFVNSALLIIHLLLPCLSNLIINSKTVISMVQCNRCHLLNLTDTKSWLKFSRSFSLCNFVGDLGFLTIKSFCVWFLEKRVTLLRKEETEHLKCYRTILVNRKCYIPCLYIIMIVI